jgi:hypothetical protein
MTPQFPAQRRAAEEFARLVDGPAPLDAAVEYADLVRTVTVLREQPRPVPRADFVASLRERLLAAADEVLAPVSGSIAPARPRRERRAMGWPERHLGAAVAALVMVGGTAGLATAAQGSLPGETLYPLKRGIEHVEVTMSTNDAAKGKELLDQASTRLTEVRAIVRSKPDDARSAALIGETLQDFRSSADKGSDLLFRNYQGDSNSKDIADVREFTTGTMQTLRTLADQSSPTSVDEFSKAGETVADIDQQARVLCVSCSDADPVSLPDALVNLTSAHALATFLSLPAQQIAKASKLAHQAEQEAKTQPAQPQAGGPTPSAGPSGPPAVGTLTDGATGLSGLRPSAGAHPLKDLVDGLTTKVPVVGTLTNGLSTTLQGLADPLGQTVEGLTHTLNGLLGGADPGTTQQQSTTK